jgi:prophage antirepressor-like protein
VFSKRYLFFTNFNKGDIPMSNEVSVFTFENQSVRTVQKDGEVWFVAKDVAETLGYTWNGTQRIEHVPAEWRGVTFVVTPSVTSSGIQKMAILSEQGLYFFLARSDKPTALPFQKWIAGEVIPSIRKTGKYFVSPEPNEPQPERIKYSVDGHVYEFPANQPVKSVSCAKSGAITFHFFGKEQKSAKREKNAPAKESPKPEPTDNRSADLLMFFQKQCKFHPDYWVGSNDLYKRYLEWTKNNSIKVIYNKSPFFHYLNKMFGKDIVGERRRFPNDRKQFRGYTGIALLETDVCFLPILSKEIFQ